MLLGRKVVEERRDEKRRRQLREGKPDVLSVQEQAPAPCADENHDQIEREGGGEPGGGRSPGDVPQPRRVNTREQQHEEGNADAQL